MNFYCDNLISLNRRIWKFQFSKWLNFYNDIFFRTVTRNSLIYRRNVHVRATTSMNRKSVMKAIWKCGIQIFVVVFAEKYRSVQLVFISTKIHAGVNGTTRISNTGITSNIFLAAFLLSCISCKLCMTHPIFFFCFLIFYLFFFFFFNILFLSLISHELYFLYIQLIFFIFTIALNQIFFTNIFF